MYRWELAMLFFSGTSTVIENFSRFSSFSPFSVLDLSSPARVHVVFADAASEEALAAITAGRPVVFAGGSVSTYGTQAACPQVAGSVHVGALSR